MKSILSLFVSGFLLFTACNSGEELEVIRQVTGPIETNAYLIYGEHTHKAALIDPGWEVDSLLDIIRERKLELEYIIATHGHIDHIYQVPIPPLFTRATCS